MSSNAKTTARKEEATTALVPKLRFPEFRGAALRSVRLGDVTEEGRRRNGKKHSVASVMGVTKADGIVPMEPRLIAADIERYKLVENDWFAYNPMRLNIGSIARWKGENEILVSPDYVVFRCITDDDWGIAPGYLDHFRQTKAWEDFVTDGGDGGVRVRIYYKDIARLQLELPSLPEQQKIAECLSSVDEMMAAQARKVDALKTHKKGLMQQLFPCEGETQPRLRFPEFLNTREWVEAPLGTLLMGSPDYGVNAAAVPFSGHLPKYLRITDISEDGRYLTEKQVSVDLDATDGNYLDEGDIVFARTGASVGKSYQYRMEDGRLVFAGFLIRVKPHPKKLVSTYLANFLTTGHFWKWVAVTSARSGQPGINSTEYSSLAVPLPPTLTEQQRIALCLSSLDALITAEIQKLEALKTRKKGLMQQLFPSLAEVEA
ncbi:hypothetical protein ASC78_17275 [Variovorax sp. Root318D1]|uniref:restriction endonuclease subunit S n=1 Tax=Variovorax sp. Root318D1 TaxID=1736513 RepID=UPI0006FFC4BE|nr:restriction endonuclease subunit S [Variovorax sp. Root318D1]KQU82344.1 hypothetical protein ASC78_17275 [Variovorax sp. Root318D1]